MNHDVLDTIDMRELGAKLRKARERRNLTQQDAAEFIDVARTTVVAIEKGERRIKADELLMLAQAYGQDVGDFLRPTRPSSEPFQPQFRAAYKRRGDEPELLASIEQLEDLATNYYELEQITEKPLKYNYPDEYQIGNLEVERVAENIAIEERRRLGLGDGPIHVLRNLLEREVGLRIFYLPITPSDYSAIYIYDHQLGGCIAINRKHPEERRRWSLAHDYAHFLVHRAHVDLFTNDYQRRPEREQFADAFATYFLMPTSSLTRYLRDVGGKLTAADLCIWANDYGVSVEAMTRRLEGMKVLPSGKWEELKDNGFRVREAQEILELSPIPMEDDVLPLRYQYLAVEAFDRALISEGLFASFLQVSRIKARQLAQRLRLEDIDLNEPL